MGCWEETCALTHIQINRGDPCVLVVMDEVFTACYERGNRMRPFNNPDDFTRIENVYRGTYNDYGWIEEVEDDREIPKGDTVERPRSQRRITIFFHADVWDAAAQAGMEAAKEWEKHRLDEIDALDKAHRRIMGERGEEYTPSIFAKKPPTKEMVAFRAVAEVAYWTRRDLMICEAFHGCQSWENHYYDLVHDLTAKAWARQKKREEDAG